MNTAEPDYFFKSQRIWFPDFEETMMQMEHRYNKYPLPFQSMISLVSYFRREISRQQFMTRFFEQNAPAKILPSDRRKFLRIKDICDAYRKKAICGAEFDKQLLICFRDRPADDVFSPAFERWEEINLLTSRLEQKMKCLPIHFDGTAWNGYLSGRVTRKEYAQLYLIWGTEDRLAQLSACEIGKESFAEKYASEISVCMRLQKLCMDYKSELLSPRDFDHRFLELAKEFCADISK